MASMALWPHPLHYSHIAIVTIVSIATIDGVGPLIFILKHKIKTSKHEIIFEYRNGNMSVVSKR